MYEDSQEQQHWNSGAKETHDRADLRQPEMDVTHQPSVLLLN